MVLRSTGKRSNTTVGSKKHLGHCDLNDIFSQMKRVKICLNFFSLYELVSGKDGCKFMLEATVFKI